MNLKKLPVFDRSQWIVLATFALIALLVLWVLISLLIQFGQYRAEVEDIKPRLARTHGLMLSEERLRQALSQAEPELNALVYSSMEDASALGTSMQQAVRGIFSRAGMNVSGSQVQAVRKLENFSRVGVTINVEGDLASLEAALLDLQEARPLVFVDQIDIRPERRRATRRGAPVPQEQRVGVRIQLASLKLEAP